MTRTAPRLCSPLTSPMGHIPVQYALVVCVTRLILLTLPSSHVQREEQLMHWQVIWDNKPTKGSVTFHNGCGSWDTSSMMAIFSEPIWRDTITCRPISGMSPNKGGIRMPVADTTSEENRSSSFLKACAGDAGLAAYT